MNTLIKSIEGKNLFLIKKSHDRNKAYWKLIDLSNQAKPIFYKIKEHRKVWAEIENAVSSFIVEPQE